MMGKFVVLMRWGFGAWLLYCVSHEVGIWTLILLILMSIGSEINAIAIKMLFEKGEWL